MEINIESNSTYTTIWQILLKRDAGLEERGHDISGLCCSVTEGEKGIYAAQEKSTTAISSIGWGILYLLVETTLEDYMHSEGQ